MEVSFIGFSGHAKRLREIVQKFPNVSIGKIYHPTINCLEQNLNCTNDINLLKKSDAIFISSPSEFHYENLIELKDYKGYIFLEKPAVNRSYQIDRLLKLPKDFKSRVYINFNFEHSKLAKELIKQINSDDLGKILWMDIHSSHGAAFNDSWNDAWRIIGGDQLGPIETTGIHFLKFVISNFKYFKKANIRTRSVVGRKNGVDTGILTMDFSDGLYVRIRNSYACPYFIRFEIFGSNGYLIYDGKNLEVFSPRETLDKKGFFTNPPLKSSLKINFQNMWQDSLSDSISFFLKKVNKRDLFLADQFDEDVKIMQVLLNAKKMKL